MRVKKFLDYITEISGTELVGPIGPGYGETRLQNKTINQYHTDLIYCQLNGRLYTIDEYNDSYGDYLKSGGTPLVGFDEENLNKVISYLQTI